MWFVSRRSKNVVHELKKILAPLEKNYVKAIILLDERGVELYSYPDDDFSKKDLQGFLNLFFASEKVVDQAFKEEELTICRNFLNYYVSSIIIKFGIYRIYLVNNRKFFLLYVIDEGMISPKLSEIERNLIEKLEEIKEKRLIEDYKCT